MKKKPFSFLFGIILLAVIILITFFVVKKFRAPGSMTVVESQAMDMSAMTAPKGAFPVAIEPAKTQDIEETVTYTGTAVPYNEQNVSPRVQGWITDMLVYPQDKVYKGQIIAKLIAPDLYTQLREVKADVENKKASLKYWEQEYKRAKKLYDGGAISLDEYQMEESQYLSAKAMLNEAKAKQNTAQIMQNYTNIESLINGVVTKRLISAGSLVRPGEVIYQISQIDPIRLQVNVAEQDLDGIKIGNSILVYPSKGKKSQALTVKVTSIFPAVDPASRTAVVEALANNPNFRFLPGQYIIMEITKNKKSCVLTVPAKAIIEKDEKSAVWVVYKQGKEVKGDDTAHLVYVKTGISDGNKTEIIDGLKQGDAVIYAGYENLNDGDKVYPVKWGQEGPLELPPPPAMEEMPGMGASTPGAPASEMPGMEMSGMKHETPEKEMQNMPGMKH